MFIEGQLYADSVLGNSAIVFLLVKGSEKTSSSSSGAFGVVLYHLSRVLLI